MCYLMRNRNSPAPKYATERWIVDKKPKNPARSLTVWVMGLQRMVQGLFHVIVIIRVNWTRFKFVTGLTGCDQ